MPAPALDPAYERVVRDSFARQTAMATLGVRLEAVAPGELRLALERSPALCQQNGFLHAGVLAAMADSACGYAALTLAPPGSDVLAVEFKISLLRPARAPRFTARARVLRPGRTLSYCECRVVGEGGEREPELVATMLSTIVIRAPGGGDRSSSPRE